ncbi:hypothetical protein LWI28_008369 [Acer negundo]|uniref:Uncharacterized protein n=1 Tax=Acer negundo TaxID=4023 RepID=A0AAD5IDS9_ACENE|nr:hypothetical protein LWI28_008369 [Acer negundo]
MNKNSLQIFFKPTHSQFSDTTSDLFFWFESMNKNKRARTSVDQPLVDVWLCELGHLYTRNFALRRAASQIPRFLYRSKVFFIR